jgi:pyridoxine 5-phosphate synthase
VKLNLEMAVNEEILKIALNVKPDQATLVPERREEITTEGGLDIITHKMRVADAIHRLQDAGISVSLFLDPETRQIEEAALLKADAVELHTGRYAGTRPGEIRQKELNKLETLGAMTRQSGMSLHAGHGLNYHNVRPVAAIEGMHELNIGHSIVARAVMVGFQEAVREMKRLVM